jgi:hypothetical protein
VFDAFFVATFNDYVKVFKQSASYKVYLNGGRFGEGLGRGLKAYYTPQKL